MMIIIIIIIIIISIRYPTIRFDLIDEVRNLLIYRLSMTSLPG